MSKPHSLRNPLLEVHTVGLQYQSYRPRGAGPTPGPPVDAYSIGCAEILYEIPLRPPHAVVKLPAQFGQYMITISKNVVVVDKRGLVRLRRLPDRMHYSQTS
jgi:hypothetical protein